jgi:DNA polymerase III psi subunit
MHLQLNLKDPLKIDFENKSSIDDCESVNVFKIARDVPICIDNEVIVSSQHPKLDNNTQVLNKLKISAANNSIS